jgi:NADP-dependent 3-hydroxy acid dehydrogenase YdfG
MSLKNKIALVTGATSGIGRATAVMFAKEGAKVFATGRSTSALAELKKEIDCATFSADLLKEGESSRVVAECVKTFGGLTTVVNCAGILAGGAFGSENCAASYDKNFDINTKGIDVCVIIVVCLLIYLFKSLDLLFITIFLKKKECLT